MSATRHAYKAELIDNIVNFYRRIGIMLNHDEALARLGFKLDNVSGAFGSSWIDDLLEFCTQNPQYHIVTMTVPGRLENRYGVERVPLTYATGIAPQQMAKDCLRGDSGVTIDLRGTLQKV